MCAAVTVPSISGPEEVKADLARALVDHDVGLAAGIRSSRPRHLRCAGQVGREGPSTVIRGGHTRQRRHGHQPYDEHYETAAPGSILGRRN
jgi:hypothetical protein